MSSATTERQVLPTNVKPVHYDVQLEPLFDSFTFNGKVSIDIKPQCTSDFITLHTLELDLANTRLQINGAETETKPVSTEYHEEDQTTTFKFDSPFSESDSLKLSIDFVGQLNDKMAGFYRSTYQHNGETKYLATTQMEPTDCRRAFPCFDEPNLKAEFTISLVGDSHLTFLSNMDVKSTTQLPDNKSLVLFNKTPKMSTYLVAFIVGDLEYIESDYKFRDIPIRVYTTPGYLTDAKYSCELAAKSLEYYEKVFNIPYPLPKMDMVGIHDFSAGAMENWGLVTYRMVDLLYNSKTSTLATKLRVTEVVAHELAHQWFGNFCTMDFWDSLWLNESFATYMSWKCCNHFFPDWKVWENFIGDSLQSALKLDGLRSSHPIEVPVNKSDEINQIFDAISYEKGSAVLKMLANWLGEEDFINGVSHYLKKNAYSNAKTEDLWDSLSLISGKDVASIMKVWTTKVGYPLITAKEVGGCCHINQHRYLTTGDVKQDDDETIYPTFLNVKTANNLDENLLNERETSIDIPKDDFFKINGDSAGVYRVSYDDERWSKLGLQASLLSVEDRIGLVSDVGALSTSGYTKTTNLLELVSNWKEESSFFVWDEIVARLSNLKSVWIFEDESVKQGLNLFIQDLVLDKCHQGGWEFNDEVESFLEQRLKSLLFAASVSCGDKVTIEYSNKAFNDYVEKGSAIHPNLRATIFNTVAENGDMETYHKLMAIYKDPKSMDEKIAILRALGKFQDEAVINKVFTLLLDGTVKPQDFYIPLQGMRASSVNIVRLFNWLKENWDHVYKILPPGLSMLSSVVSIATSGFTKSEQLAAVESFFASKNTKGYDKSLAQSLEVVKSNSQWLARDSEGVKQWLVKHGYVSK